MRLNVALYLDDLAHRNLFESYAREHGVLFSHWTPARSDSPSLQRSEGRIRPGQSDDQAEAREKLGGIVKGIADRKNLNLLAGRQGAKPSVTNPKESRAESRMDYKP